jgi:predicted CopG family antitoxin
MENKKMRKTISERILNLASRKNFDSKVARKNFTGYSKEEIHNSVMRTARKLAEEGMLRRVDSGTYRK